MPVKDFMTKRVVYISPDTKVAHAADIMREQGLRRLPVIENDQLVGLVTDETLAEATPSKATSLSIYEMNYLLNKTKIRDIMIKEVVTVSSYESLEDAIYIMMRHNVGVLPVVDNGQVCGIITDKDIFKAFLEVSGYGQEGIRVVILADDHVGVLAKAVDVIAAENLNISRTIALTRKSGKVSIEIQIDGRADLDVLKNKLLEQEIDVESVIYTESKYLN